MIERFITLGTNSGSSEAAVAVVLSEEGKSLTGQGQLSVQIPVKRPLELREEATRGRLKGRKESVKRMQPTHSRHH